MTISKCNMRFIIQTVVDVTETNARKGTDKKAENQQQNYNTVIQTLGLRANVEPIQSRTEILDLGDKSLELAFGKNIKGKQRVWTIELENPFEGAITIDSLKDDFDLVPVISDLDETVSLHNKMFSTKHETDTNIFFKQLNNNNGE